MTLRALATGLAALIALSAPAAAQDMFGSVGSAFGYNSGYTDFEGFYAGIYGGGFFAGEISGTLGGTVGMNFALTPQFYAGLEFQAGLTTVDREWGLEGLALLRGGVAVTPQVLAYAAAGAGNISGDGVYALGGGAEFALTDIMHVRGELLGIGEWGGGMNGARATVGLVWHLD